MLKFIWHRIKQRKQKKKKITLENAEHVCKYYAAADVAAVVGDDDDYVDVNSVLIVIRGLQLIWKH